MMEEGEPVSLNESTWSKIEESVREILATSDLETATEFSVRSAAAHRLGLDLSGFAVQQLIRQVVDIFLLSTAVRNLLGADNNTSANNDNGNNDGAELPKDYTGKLICQLSDRKRVTVYDSNGKAMVSFRDSITKDGRMQNRKGVNSGMSLTVAEWSIFRNNFPSIEEAIEKMESLVRKRAVAEQNNGKVTNLPADSAACNSQVGACSSDSIDPVHCPSKRQRTEVNTSGFVVASGPHQKDSANTKQNATRSRLIATFGSHEEFSAERQHTVVDSTRPSVSPSPGNMHYEVNANHSEKLVPIQTARLDGKNYHTWQLHMELFLKQLNLVYVLAEPCPRVSFSRGASSHERAKTQEDIQRWVDDDYMCRQHILKSLCDGLFQLYSLKRYSARDLWEELKLVYDEDFGTKRSQISKYVNFQMADGVSVLDQVQEIHKIADSIMSSGTWIDENFHISVIVSKLPPSWKDFRVRMMHEDHLPLNVLMLRIQDEEESRRRYMRETNYEKSHFKHQKTDGIVKVSSQEKRRVCYNCHRDGHIIRDCPDRKFDGSEKSKTKDNRVLRPQTQANSIERSNEKENRTQDADTNITETANGTSRVPDLPEQERSNEKENGTRDADANITETANGTSGVPDLPEHV